VAATVGEGSRLGRKNKAKAGKTNETSNDGENDGAHDVKHPCGRAIATARVGVEAGVGRLRGGGVRPLPRMGGAKVEP
jgi:hypothetical protein